MTHQPAIRTPLAAAGVMLAALAGLPAAGAADFPTRPLRIIVGFPPGGATDLVARIIAPRLGESLKQQVIVDNRAGANGTIGAEIAARSTPDGYNLHLATLGALVISPSITRVSYDPLKDFATISMAVQLQNMFLVHPSLAARTIPELITLARQKPGGLNYASSGLGSPGHLAGELFKALAKVDMTHVPYKGGGPALADLLGGHLPVFVAVISTGVPPVKAGRAVALAVTGAKRSSALPGVPTVAETPGLKGYEASNWYGMVAPAGTPPAVIKRLQDELHAALKATEVRDALLSRGIDPDTSTPEEFTAYIRSETAKWEKVIRSANLKRS